MDNINKADIVTRMRWIDDGWEIWNPGEHKPTKNVGKWCHEAADDIERLRFLLHEARGAIFCWNPVSEAGNKMQEEIINAIDAELEGKE